MTDRAFFAALIQEQYGADLAHLRFFDSSTNAERAVIQVRRSDGSAWIVRGYRGDIPVPDWLGGCGTRDTRAWLLSRAATLAHLARLGFPAPRVVPTGAVALVGEAQGWYTLVTTFIKFSEAIVQLALRISSNKYVV